jgi:prepilin-type N-terminal cleavage/methylation domain-containing protein
MGVWTKRTEWPGKNFRLPGLSSKRKGFSLIELVAAVMILAIVFSGVTALDTARVRHAKKSRSEQDIAVIHQALSCYLYFHGEDPEGLKDITVDNLFRKGFLIGENKSPWGTPYKLTTDGSAILVEPAPKN